MDRRTKLGEEGSQPFRALAPQVGETRPAPQGVAEQLSFELTWNEGLCPS